MDIAISNQNDNVGCTATEFFAVPQCRIHIHGSRRFLNYQTNSQTRKSIPLHTCTTMTSLNSCTVPPSFLRRETAGFDPNRRRLLSASTREFNGSLAYSPRGLRSPYCCRSTVKETSENGAAAAAVAQSEIPVRIVAVVGEGSVSPLKSTPWYDVMLHTVSR